MAVWRPKHENTLIIDDDSSYLYDKMPCGGSVGGLYKRLRCPAAPPPADIFVLLYRKKVNAVASFATFKKCQFILKLLSKSVDSDIFNLLKVSFLYILAF